MTQDPPPSRSLYGSDEVFEAIDRRYEELLPQYRDVHGGRLSKTYDFYPALLRAAVRDSTVEDELDL